MSVAIIKSINVGKPMPWEYQNKSVSSGIIKEPVETSLYLSKHNFAGDGQADLINHGGEDKAVCLYPFEHYAYWEKELNRNLLFGAFGENLTTVGLLEQNICIGDIFQLGEAIVQISQPRKPCYKLSMIYDANDLPLKVQNTGYTGYYFRVLKEGTVSREQGLTLLERHSKGVTVAYVNQIMFHDQDNIDGIKKIISVDELAEGWRATFRSRLGELEGDITKG